MNLMQAFKMAFKSISSKKTRNGNRKFFTHFLYIE